MIYKLRVIIVVLWSILNLFPRVCLANEMSSNTKFVRFQDTKFLSYDELVYLSNHLIRGPKLEKKLEEFWKHPVISNEAWYDGSRPREFSDHRLGSVLVVASWNIEKSIEIPKIIQLLTDPDALDRLLPKDSFPKDSKARAQIENQLKKLQAADILILQEIDVGVKRSGYMDCARELAQALKMNYVYAPAYLEVDPVLLGTEKIYLENGEEDKESMEFYATDSKRYKGVFGSAVLSRYPIKAVKAFPLKHQGYDWYSGEKTQSGFLEKSRRFGAKTTFKNVITREIKVGGRVFLQVDLEVPHLPEKTLSVINVHLEIKCRPEERTRQIREILVYAKEIRNPVIMAGDFNSASQDLSAVSVARTVKRTAQNPTTWFSAAVNYLNPNGLLINTTRGLSNITKNLQDPTAKHIPVIAPNAIRPLFESIEQYQFEDGGVFDFRGDRDRSVGRKSKKLSNSNQRDLKGFKTTFSVRRPIGPVIGKLRLDWFFVKSYMKNNSSALNAPYQFAPHFGETLEELNTAVSPPLSDHHPSIIYLPWEEPKSIEERAKKS